MSPAQPGWALSRASGESQLGDEVVDSSEIIGPLNHLLTMIPPASRADVLRLALASPTYLETGDGIGETKKTEDDDKRTARDLGAEPEDEP